MAESADLAHPSISSLRPTRGAGKKRATKCHVAQGMRATMRQDISLACVVGLRPYDRFCSHVAGGAAGFLERVGGHGPSAASLTSC